MEREPQNQPEFNYGRQPDKRVDPAVLDLIVRQQISAILKACEQQEQEQWRKDNMNA